MTELETREQRLKKKKQKRYVTIGVLAGIVCLLCVAYYGLGKYQEYKAEQEQKKAQDSVVVYTLANFSMEEVVSYTLTNSEYVVTFVQTEDGWSSEAETELLVNQTTVETIISEIAALTSNKIAAETMEREAEFGLDAPQAVLSVLLQDGSEQVFSLGDNIQTGSGYYLSSSEKEEIYLVDSAVYTSLTTAYDDFWEEPEVVEETEEADSETTEEE